MKNAKTVKSTETVTPSTGISDAQMSAYVTLPKVEAVNPKAKAAARKAKKIAALKTIVGKAEEQDVDLAPLWDTDATPVVKTADEVKASMKARADDAAARVEANLAKLAKTQAANNAAVKAMADKQAKEDAEQEAFDNASMDAKFANEDRRNAKAIKAEKAAKVKAVASVKQLPALTSSKRGKMIVEMVRDMSAADTAKKMASEDSTTNEAKEFALAVSYRSDLRFYFRILKDAGLINTSATMPKVFADLQ